MGTSCGGSDGARWTAPGAGFAETALYNKSLAPGKPERTWWEQKLWRWYDATGYAANLAGLPTVAYSGEIDPQKQAEYEVWLEEKFGPQVRESIDTSKAAMAKLSKSEIEASMAELKDIEQRLAQEMRDGVEASSADLDPLIERHRAWVGARWGSPCPPAAYAGLAEVYEHPDFQSRYESIETGFAAYLCAAMRSWAQRQA